MRGHKVREDVLKGALRYANVPVVGISLSLPTLVSQSLPQHFSTPLNYDRQTMESLPSPIGTSYPLTNSPRASTDLTFQTARGMSPVKGGLNSSLTFSS